MTALRRYARFAVAVAHERTPRPLRRAALDVVLSATRVLLDGDRVACPACEATAGRFMRGRCPVCGAASRQRLIALFLRRELQLESAPSVRLLHFAPEPGLIRMLSALPNVDYVPADLDPARGHERVDATAIALEPGFDAIITSHVLEHVPDDAAAMAEMRRVLRPGGWAIVIVPVYDSLEQTIEGDDDGSAWSRFDRYGQHDHVRIYAPDVVDRLRAAGLDVQKRVYAEEVGADDARRYGLRASDVIYQCRRPQPTGPAQRPAST